MIYSGIFRRFSENAKAIEKVNEMTLLWPKLNNTTLSATSTFHSL